jgi:hypothetical protein
MKIMNSKIGKSTLGVLVAGALAVSLAACSTPAEETTESSAPASSETSNETPDPTAVIDELGGVDTQVTLDQGFLDAITGLGLTPGVLGGATLTDGVLAFPITGGNVEYWDPELDYRPYVQGSIEHDGSGISLTAGDTVVELTDFRIDPGTSELFGTVTANGTEVGQDILIFDLNGSTLNPLEEGPNGEAILQGTEVYVSEDAAGLLNDTFGTDAVVGGREVGLLVGVAQITAVPAS